MTQIRRVDDRSVILTQIISHSTFSLTNYLEIYIYANVIWVGCGTLYYSYTSSEVYKTYK